MDLVDALRRQGLGGILKLPQLIVCGDQPSGKSSVLEAISQIPFKRKENLCTRFATEVVLCSHDMPSITTKILPDKSKPSLEQQRLREFSRTLSDFRNLPRARVRT